ncbi:MAG: DUF6526 family protein [Acidobacteriaceae bacterium]
MSENKPQSYANHARTDPWFHYFLGPVSFITFIWTIVHLVRHPHATSAWAVVVAFAWIVFLIKMRLYSLKVQDRVIRLEERMRLTALLPESKRAFILELTEQQLVALRFASDTELPALAERAWKEKLTQKQIKQAIQVWRPDTFRV